jgi:predicted DNA-binding protein YlxM (UPF0122 family)
MQSEMEGRLADLERFRDMDQIHVEPLYAERRESIRLAHSAGASISEIARRLNVGRKVVYDAIK